MHIQRKWSVITTAALAAMLLAACGSQPKQQKSAADPTTEYRYVFSADPESFDYTATSRTTDSDHLSNFIDGLLERDQYGRLQPDMAQSWSVSDDGLTYTYKLRKGVKWVDAQGNAYATVKAPDFVTGLKHAVKAKSETLYVVQDSIKGLDDYVTGKTTDFSKVGVKALDDYTVQYTLNQPESYWNTKLTYGVMYPVNAKFLRAKGDDFGKAKADGILYNGPYLLDNFTSKSVIEYKQNPKYWDKQNVHIKHVKETYDDGSKPDDLYKAFQKGDLSAARLYPTSAQFKQVEKENGQNILWSDPDSSVYNFTFNLKRRSYNLTSKKTAKAKADTQKAILNQDFRLAIQAAFDKASYNGQKYGVEGGIKALRNMVTPYNFVTIGGNPYGQSVAKFLSERNPAVFKGVNLNDQQDATYKPAKAKALFAKAKTALQAQGVSFPVHLDLPADKKVALIMNQNKSFKASIEETLGKDNVVIDIQQASEGDYNAATYDATTGDASDYDVAHATGWGPDYDDPSAYLDIYNSKDGAFLKNFGLDIVKDGKQDATADVKAQLGFDEYDKLVAQAESIYNDDDARYTAFAKAEAWLLNTGIQMATNSTGGVPSVTKSYQMAQPVTRPYVQSALGDKRFKYVKLEKHVISAKDYNKVKQTWDNKRQQLAKTYGQQVGGKE